MEKPLVGISACLLGENVRYDGGHRLDRSLRDVLGRFVDYVPVCPEVECGLGVPREPVHLRDVNGETRLVTCETGVDLTDRMMSWAGNRVRELAALPLCGFVFRTRSPSCALSGLPVTGSCITTHDGRGLFAGALTGRCPGLPVCEDTDIGEPAAMDGFLQLVIDRSGRQASAGERRERLQ
jgi:uncharacterized protein YbbK (DUF523 family)